MECLFYIVWPVDFLVQMALRTLSFTLLCSGLWQWMLSLAGTEIPGSEALRGLGKGLQVFSIFWHSDYWIQYEKNPQGIGIWINYGKNLVNKHHIFIMVRRFNPFLKLFLIFIFAFQEYILFRKQRTRSMALLHISSKKKALVWLFMQKPQQTSV